MYRGDAVADGIVFLGIAAALIVGETGILRRLDGKSIKPRRLVLAIVLVRALYRWQLLLAARRSRVPKERNRDGGS